MIPNSNQERFYQSQVLSDKEFEQLSTFIYSQYGIKMPPIKRVMLQGRLQKRLRQLNIPTFKDYCNYVFSQNGAEEVIHMMDVVSTNKTDFFREPVHFEYLRETVLPEFINRGKRFVKVWSAGSSSGEEAYTIAITLNEFSETKRQIDFQIIGTDISTIVLNTAIEGIYKEARLEGIPLNIKHKYFLKSRDPDKKLVRVVPKLRAKVKFGRLNFMDTTYPINETFDVIFCRNTLIYFDRETQEKVISKLCNHLDPNGYFFLGHSESLTNMNVPLKSVKPTIYRKINLM